MRIIHGDTLNTNTHHLSHSLCSEGLSLGLQLACSDKTEEIVKCLQFLAQDHDIILITGGLGPTTDDNTRFALAKWTNDPLVQHEDALKHVENRLIGAKVAINAGNLQQCLFPATATLLPNPQGSAVGCYYIWQDKTIILLPGPPRECLPMFNDFVMPRLRQTLHSAKHILKWRLFGVAESEIGEILENALSAIECQTGYRLDSPYIEFKVRCRPNLESTVKAIVDPLVAQHCISSYDKKASEELVELILKVDQPLTIVDEVTGGLLQTLLSKPETHELIYFYPNQNTDLNFHLSGLREYWSNQMPTGTTELTIHYENRQQEGGETHELPYRSPLVVNYAAEWLSFRLFHLINQLH